MGRGSIASRLVVVAAALTALAAPLAGQSVLERSPNIQGVWGVEYGQAAFVFAHRFEFISGGDELFSIPTLTLAAGLPLGLAIGLDYTSNSEAILGNEGGNEAQYWLKRPFRVAPVDLAVMGAYNAAAASWDGALNVRFEVTRFQLFGEGRVFSDLFNTGDAAAGGAIGAAIRLTEFLAVTGDVGKVLTEEGIPAAWSGAIAIGIPVSPHTFSLHVANSGATTLQGASREKRIGVRDLRYGFTFTVPLGGRGRWGRIFDSVEEDE